MVFRSFLLFLLTACPSAMPSLAVPQSLLSSTQDKYSVAGVVFNSVTGEPIRGALVQIYVNGQSSLLTGPDGKFQFDGLPAGYTTSINVRKPGFFSEDDLQPSRLYRGGFTIGPNTLPMVVKLVPEGVIYGRISEEDGNRSKACRLPYLCRFCKVVERFGSNGPEPKPMTMEASASPNYSPETIFCLLGPAAMP